MERCNVSPSVKPLHSETNLTLSYPDQLACLFLSPIIIIAGGVEAAFISSQSAILAVLASVIITSSTQCRFMQVPPLRDSLQLCLILHNNKP